ncbi:MAG TPA: hypothetical protein VMP01_17720 [Pirellulaceae bacterium]|nr:hypothetical protein [Pirellulaceae bacterium]
MSEFLFQYEKVDPVSWAYLSSLLLVGLFFKFNRFWSVRNLDLVLLILLAPGLLMVNEGQRLEGVVLEALNQDADLNKPSIDPASGEISAEARTALADETHPVVHQAGTKPADSSEPTEPPPAAEGDSLPTEETQELPTKEESRDEKGEALKAALAESRKTSFWGYAWLLIVCGLLMVRLLFDPTMVRRPLLEPNLSSGGLLFIGISLFLFLMANVVTSENITAADLKGAQGARALLERTDRSTPRQPAKDYSQLGPGYDALHLIPSIVTTPFAKSGDAPEQKMTAQIVVAKTMVILAHLAVVVAMVLIGYLHFENIKMGIGAATIYLMLPYTAQMTGHVMHVLPAALLLWAIVLYRRPILAGVLMGTAMSAFYYPFFLLPLWLSFYWQRGVMRFSSALLVSVALMVLTLVFVSQDMASFLAKIQSMFGFWFPKMAPEQLGGIWQFGWDPIYRLPIIVSCGIIAASLILWPAQKNLGTLLSCTAAVMVAVQFWHAHGEGGGMYMAWFLPLTLLTIFRPNLEDRVALSVLGDDWFTRRRARLALHQRAA